MAVTPPAETKISLTDERSLSLMRRLFREAAMPYIGHMILAVICMSLVAGTTALTAWLLDPVVNKVFVEQDANMLWMIGGAVCGVFVVKSLASYCQDVLLAYVGQNIIADTQNRLFSCILSQEVALFQDKTSGTLVSHFVYDINAMRVAVSNAFIAIGRDALSVTFLIGVTFYQDWLLACISMVVAPISIIPIQRLSKHMRRVARQTQEEMGGMNTLLMQAFQGIRIIKSFRLEESETSRVKTVAYKLRDLSIGATRLEAAAQPIIDVFGGVAITAVIIYGGSRVIDGATTPGAFFSFIAAIMMAYQPLRSLSKMNVTIQQGLAAAARVFALIDRQPALLEAPDAKDVERVSGDVVFNNVSFSYNDEDFALNGVSFTAPAGGITALVGPSGAGKSTVFSLIPRFYDPQSGDVFINGVNVKHATLGSLRDAISIVSQEATLFNDTIANNIRCGNPDADDAAVERAARMAAAHEFIVEQPDGYDTMIGEHGMRLSGGQRQRIAIARAILKDAPILLLDEATSALDTESERLIQQALSQLMQGRTTIVIAHRLSTIRDADVIHAFDKGKVVETGDHTSLLAQNGLYARLHALQFHEGA